MHAFDLTSVHKCGHLVEEYKDVRLVNERNDWIWYVITLELLTFTVWSCIFAASNIAEPAPTSCRAKTLVHSGTLCPTGKWMTTKLLLSHKLEQRRYQNDVQQLLNRTLQHSTTYVVCQWKETSFLTSGM